MWLRVYQKGGFIVLTVVVVGSVELGVGGSCLLRFVGGVVYDKALWFGRCKR